MPYPARTSILPLVHGFQAMARRGPKLFLSERIRVGREFRTGQGSGLVRKNRRDGGEARRDIEIRGVSVFFVPRREVFVAQAQVQAEIGGHAVVVDGEGVKSIAAVVGARIAVADGGGFGKTEQEIREIVSGAGNGKAGRVVRRRWKVRKS